MHLIIAAEILRIKAYSDEICRDKSQTAGIKETLEAMKVSGALVRETGLEPASTYVHMNLNHARLPISPFLQKIVSRGGFELSTLQLSLQLVDPPVFCSTLMSSITELPP